MLEDFARWWLTTRPFRPPVDGFSKPSAGSSGVVLFRQAPYQVQLFLFEPGLDIPTHRHAGVDSFEHYVTGDVYFVLNGAEVADRSMFVDDAEGVAAIYFSDGNAVRVGPEDWHSAQIGPRGGAFLSIQHWLNGTPGLVEQIWEGSPLDATHAAQL
jgi:hypothetical protein